MITVEQFVASIFWILGLGIILASWSMAYYQAQSRHMRVLALLSERRYDMLVMFGLILTFVGWGAADSRTWASVIWYFLAAAALVRTIFLLRQGSVPT